MDPQRGLWNCAINTLVQRSSGDQLLGSDLYQELRLKAQNSFRSRPIVLKFGKRIPFIEYRSPTEWVLGKSTP
ncbi:hypothetical protein TNCV_1920951 [Trichonephila clavipes]|nr:hypothetical protein TNCV_1920951 [Trichonephila clavipes]